MKNYIVIILFIASLVGCNSKSNEKNHIHSFTTTLPVVADTVIYSPYVAQIKSVQHIELRALEKGYLEQIYIDEGQFVKKGTLLFQILPVVYEAEAKKSNAELNFAEIEYYNTKALADSNVVSKNELALAKAKKEKAAADYALASAHLGFTKIKAPFDGIVGRFYNVRKGSLLDEGELLTTLSDNSKMWVYFNVPESEYINFATHNQGKKNIKVKLQMANNEFYNHEGFIETIEADFNNETGNIAFRAGFENPLKLLRHGETGNILMPLPLKSAMFIPQEAVFEVLDKKFVYVVDNKSIIHSREVKIGNELPHIYTIVEGLNEDDRILVEGLRKVKNGDKIHSNHKPLYVILNELNHLKAE